ncbi:hypothetical protein LC593_31905 [Nostoc sp. CHAB 5844]|nr:hypothetical protein [Nostoc sp. CHAB 5844]
MAGTSKHDWDYWRYKYVSGDEAVTLEVLSRSPNAPGLRALKTRSTQESWVEQRKAFRHQAIAKVTESATAQQALHQTQQLVDAAEAIARHIKLAKALQSLAASRIKNLSPTELSVKDLLQFIKEGTNIERLAIGLSTERTEVDVKIDFSALSDEQLERLAKGEDPRSVLN